MRRKRNIAPWLLGIGVATALFGAVLLFASFQYIGNDDTPILRAFMGYEGGEPVSFHLYIHTAFAWLLWGLAKLFPGVAWFSILQLFLLWFAQVVIVKSLAQLARRRGYPLRAGALGGAVFLLGFALFVTARITYTTTSALCGAAAVLQLASVHFTAQRKRTVIGSILGSAALLLCAYCLRQFSVLPPLCFWLLVLAVKLLSAFGRGNAPWRLARPVFTAALATLLLFGLFMGVRIIDIRQNHAEDFLAWQQARIRLFDYTDYSTTTTPETLAEVGWSDNEFALITYWYFMDDNITTDAFDTLYAQQMADDAGLTLSDRANAALATLTDCFTVNTAVRYGLWAALALAAAALLWRLGSGDRNPWGYAGMVLAVLGGGLLLAYLAWTGRLPMRAALSVLLPMAAAIYALALAPAPYPEGRTSAEMDPAAAPSAPLHSPQSKKNAGPGPVVLAMLATAALAVSLWFTVSAALANAPAIRPQTEEETNYSVMNLTDLDTYALDNPDMLFIYDLSLASDSRLFPDTKGGVPGNVMFWGGYPSRSPNWYRMLADYGITEMNASIFLRDNVVLASTDAEPWQCMMGYVDESTDENVDWMFYDEYGYLFFFQLFTF